MTARTFEHPLHRHAAVAPVLHLIDAHPGDSLGRGQSQAAIAKLRALEALEGWAMKRFALEQHPGHARGFVERMNIPKLAEFADLPTPIRDLHRVDEHDDDLTEVGRLAAVEGPKAAQAFIETLTTPSLSARRTAAEGWWPAVEPVFVGRLHAEVDVSDYRPSVALARALAADRQFGAARRVARRLPFRLQRRAERAIVGQQVATGVRPVKLSEALHDEYLWQSARLAADRQNEAAALELVAEMRAPARRAVARHEVLERVGALQPTMHGEPDSESAPPGDRLLMQAEIALLMARPSRAWDLLCAAATGPRQDASFWLDGRRPDLRIARALVSLALKHGPMAHWPWGRRQQAALLDRLDAIAPAIESVSGSQIEDALHGGAIRAGWLRARIRQASFVRAIERFDVRTVDRHLRGQPQAEAFLRGLMGDLAFGQSLSRDPADPIRALYDDGLARSPRAARRRSGLLQAARRTLNILLQGDESAAPAAGIRLGTIAYLGGARVQRTLQHQLRQTSSRHPIFSSMLCALVRIEGPRCADRLFANPESFGYGIRNVAIHRALEDERIVAGGFTEAVGDLLRAMDEANVNGTLDVNGWWFELCDHWWSTHRAAPTESILRWLATQDATALKMGPRRMLEQFSDRLESLKALDPWRLSARLHEHPDELAMLVLGSPGPRAYGPAWSVADYERMMARLYDGRRIVGTPDSSLVRQWASGRPQGPAQRMAAGRPPTRELESPVCVVGQPQLQLRYLNKGRDILRHWRFADVVDCCYNSRHEYYLRGDTQGQILRLWRDPLSFCFEILRRGEVDGFVFGGFARVGVDDALVLNGIYARRKTILPEREALLATIRSTLQEPLRIGHVGVACINGGHGPLPEAYGRRELSIWRYRALRVSPAYRVRIAHDDIGETVNAWAPSDLYWGPLKRG